jgi:hypothetical protein
MTTPSGTTSRTLAVWAKAGLVEAEASTSPQPQKTSVDRTFRPSSVIAPSPRYELAPNH